MPNIIEISSFEVPELDVFARLTEGQLRSRMEPEKGITGNTTMMTAATARIITIITTMTTKAKAISRNTA